jgi:hypothetical protein
MRQSNSAGFNSVRKKIAGIHRFSKNHPGERRPRQENCPESRQFSKQRLSQARIVLHHSVEASQSGSPIAPSHMTKGQLAMIAIKANPELSRESRLKRSGNDRYQSKIRN